jgi:hypothetical protein
MSFHVFFSFSSGFSAPLKVPKGTKQSYIEHVERVEKTLGLKRTKYKDNPIHWESFNRDLSKIDDEVLCETLQQHNAWVRECYNNLGFWSKHPFTIGKGYEDQGPNKTYPAGWAAETITPEDAQLFWHGFEQIEVPVEKWTQEYYVNRMQHLYEVMRGRDSEGVCFDEKPLTEKQAAAVIRIFDQYLDAHDMRLDVPRDRDYLASSYDGGYDWCEKCGCAVHPDDIGDCAKKKCPLREERDL